MQARAGAQISATRAVVAHYDTEMAFELLHVNRLNETTLASPALVGGRWYWRTQRHLLCIGKGKD